MNWTEVLSELQSSASTDIWAILYLICQALDEAKIPLPVMNSKNDIPLEEVK